MGKISRYFGVAAMTLLTGYATAAAAAQGSPWYLTVLFWAFIIAGVISIITGINCA